MTEKLTMIGMSEEEVKKKISHEMDKIKDTTHLTMDELREVVKYTIGWRPWTSPESRDQATAVAACRSFGHSRKYNCQYILTRYYFNKQ